MEVPLLVEKGVGIMYLVIGLSLIVQPSFWVECVDRLRSDLSRVLPLAYIGLAVGLVVVLLHNQWSWSPSVLVTVLGWLALIKSALFLLFPRASLKLLPRQETLRKVILIEGPVVVIICVAILYSANSP